ncbi:MAG: hypothetical protein M3Y81_16040 [Chloroflexota bacterium]|nr:hypothetical protein [Chloroflexota bacterium]
MKYLQKLSGSQDAVEHGKDFPPDIIRLLEILARIERRRQERLRAMRVIEKS